jgi:hypothetical protein
MTVEAALDLARSYGVEVRLNAAQDGLRLEYDDDPPQALVNVLKRAKWEIVAALRRHEIERQRPLIAGWINDHFVSTPPNICRHCGEGAREGNVFVRLYCGDDSGDVHTSCQPAWQEAEEAKARAALGLVPLTGLFDRHFPLLYDIEEARPDDVNDAQWDVAMRGLRTFLATGGTDEALRLGWTNEELFRVPLLWARVDMCGVALLIGDRGVIGITPDAIQIRTPSGAVQTFGRRHEIDYCLIYETRRNLLRRDVNDDEAHCRSYEYVVSIYRDKHRDASLEEAKAAVLKAIGQGEEDGLSCCRGTLRHEQDALVANLNTSMPRHWMWCGGGRNGVAPIS